MDKRETRTFQIRAAPEESRVITGYAVVFNAPANLGWCEEVIDPRAFEGVDLSDVRILWGHDTNRVLGRVGVNLQLAIDDSGVMFRCALPDTNDGEDAYTLVSTGIVDECSFAFSVDLEEWDETNQRRTIKKIRKLWEVTVCSWGAYPQTVVQAVEKNTGPDLGLLAEAYEL